MEKPPEKLLKKQLEKQLERRTILFEDDLLVVVNKPSGVPSQTTLDPRRPSIEQMVQAHCGAKRAFLLHRLDADTSGVLAFAKSRTLAAELSSALRNRQWMKVYWALVETAVETTAATKTTVKTAIASTIVPPIERSATVENHLKRTRAKRNGRPVILNLPVRSGGDYARTDFRLLARGVNGHLLLAAEPKTGRMHQIRSHLASLGHPIVGDPLYNPSVYGSDFSPPRTAQRLALHALSLELPIENENRSFFAPPPKAFVALAESFGLTMPLSP